MNGRLFWAIVVGFLCGVFAASIISLGYTYAFACVIVAFFLSTLTLVSTRLQREVTIAAVLLFAMAVGVARMDLATISPDPLLSKQLGKHVVLEGVVVAEPDKRESSVRVSLQATGLVETVATSSVDAGVLVVVPNHTDVAYGDKAVVAGVLKLPAKFDSGEGRQFDYPHYLAAQGLQYQLSPASFKKERSGGGASLKAAAIAVKETFERGLEEVLPEPEAGFAGGITVGDKRSIGKELSADFQTAGLIHMIVLSGYNITIVLNAAFWLLARSPIVRSFRLVPLGLSLAIVTFFILMSGGASSAMRAGLMALIAVYARYSHRTFLPSRALMVAAAGIVFWNPYALVFDPGFQLSFLATLGLIAFTPLVAGRLAFVPEKWGLREIASSTIGTQIAVLPLLLYQNGQLSLYALPANILTLPLVPLAMLFSMIAGIGGALFGPFATVVALPAYLLLTYIIHITVFIANLPLAGVAVPAFSAWLLLLAYLLLIVVALRFHKKAIKE